MNFNLLYTMKDAAMKSGGWWEKRASCCDAHAPYSIINESEKSHSISTVAFSTYRNSKKDFRTNYCFLMQRLNQELFISFENWIVDVESIQRENEFKGRNHSRKHCSWIVYLTKELSSAFSLLPKVELGDNFLFRAKLFIITRLFTI